MLCVAIVTAFDDLKGIVNMQVKKPSLLLAEEIVRQSPRSQGEIE